MLARKKNTHTRYLAVLPQGQIIDDIFETDIHKHIKRYQLNIAR
jgi:hypothetical protein